jgi:hypothetical protein
MELRETIAQEKQHWAEQRQQWEQEIDLLEREADSLQKEIDQGSGQASSVERERADVLARNETMAAELDDLRSVLSRAEADLRQWKVWIPEGLQGGLASAFRALPESEPQASRRTLVQRAQAVVALYSQIESLQHGFHRTREILATAEGTRRQVEVLYIGLARAFAVSPDDTWAAIGLAGKEGWTWRPQVDQAGAVRSVIAVFSQRETARLVDLPMGITGESRP